MNFDATGIEASAIIALSDRLRAELIGTGRFDVMERARMDEILRAQGSQQTRACNTLRRHSGGQARYPYGDEGVLRYAAWQSSLCSMPMLNPAPTGGHELFRGSDFRLAFEVL